MNTLKTMPTTLSNAGQTTPQNIPDSGVPSARIYGLSAALCATALLLPFLLVEIPPITDLPQQTAQIHLLFEAIDGDQNYRVQALDPNKLGYLPLLVGWQLLSPLAAGRMAVAVLGVLWVVSIHTLARATGRSPVAAALASLFFFNHTMYWGLLNFLVGLPLFCLLWRWLRRRCLRRSPVDILRHRWRTFLLLPILLLSLYSAHVLWLAAGLGFLLLAVLARRVTPWTLLTAAPALALVAWWYPRLNSAGFVSETAWGHGPLGRLRPEWLLNSAFGGLRGNHETMVATALLLWLTVGLGQAWWARRRGNPDLTKAQQIDLPLLATSALFLLAALALPAVVQHTIFFASRWLPVAAVFLVLAVPTPQLRPLLRATFPFLLWAALITATVHAWVEFEHEELAGLHPGLASIPEGSRVLGLDYMRTSEYIQGFPFYHLYAWSQPLHGGELAHSFANEASSLVVFHDLPRQHPWTEHLDWRARRVRRSDMPHFDFVLVHGGPEIQTVFLSDDRLASITPEARWRLYQVRSAPPPAEGYTSPRPSPN